MIKKFFKQFLCDHSIEIKTENPNCEDIVLNDHFLIVKTIVKCKKCDKTFIQNPNAMCCYVMHIHHEILKDIFYTKMARMKQP